MRYSRLCTHFPWQVGVIVPLICAYFLIALIGAAAPAEQVVELWRGGGFNLPFYVSVNPTDGSCWVADGGNDQVVHLSATGAELWRGGAFLVPLSISANPTDGSCWVADTYNNQVVHLAQDGTQLWRGGGFYCPYSVSVNPADGACWVADTENSQVVHLAQDGTELWRSAGWPTFDYPQSVSVNPSDGSCWAADGGNSQVVHLAQSGTELWQGGGFYYPLSVSVNPTDASCWVTDFGSNQVVHLAQNGTELWRGGGFAGPCSVSVNPTDGSCWVADTHNNQVVHLAEAGTELWRGGGFAGPFSVSVNPADGSCWVADHDNNQVVHLGILTPAAPSGLAGQAASATRVLLTWKDNSNNETGFRILRKQGTGTWVVAGTVPAGQSWYWDPPSPPTGNLTTGALYTCGVRAYNSYGESPPSNLVKIKPVPVPSPWPSNLVATVVSATQINLAWRDKCSNETGYKVLCKKGSGSWFIAGTLPANTTSFEHTGLTSYAKYTYGVRAFNSYGDSLASNLVTATPGPLPAAPSNLVLTVVSKNQINLAWKDNATNETGFKVLRKTGTGSWSVIAILGVANVTTYQNTDLTPATTYSYGVRAYNSYGDSLPSNTRTATTPSG